MRSSLVRTCVELCNKPSVYFHLYHSAHCSGTVQAPLQLHTSHFLRCQHRPKLYVTSSSRLKTQSLSDCQDDSSPPSPLKGRLWTPSGVTCLSCRQSCRRHCRSRPPRTPDRRAPPGCQRPATTDPTSDLDGTKAQRAGGGSHRASRRRRRRSMYARCGIVRCILS